MTRVEIDNDYVYNYWMHRYNSGIIMLTINTVNRWVDYARINNREYTIDEYRLTITDIRIPKYFSCYHTQNKDQINFVWIPNELINDNKRLTDIILKRRHE